MSPLQQEFESWAEKQGLGLIKYWSDDQYFVTNTSYAWQAWQASRAALVVELPISDFPDGCGDTYEAIDVDAMREAITKTGVRVK